MKMKRVCMATVAALSVVSAAANAALGDLTNIPYVTYGDGQSYSLPIAQIVCQNSASFNGVDCGTYRVASTPGQIQDLVVLATGSEGQQVTTNFSGMDNAYSTPSGVNGSPYFAPESNTDGTGTSRGFEGTIANNGETTWDSSLAALQTFLAGNDPIFFFNNNQVNSGDSADQQLAAWARLSITDGSGNLVDLDPNSVANTLVFANRTPITGINSCLGGTGAPSPYAVVPDGGGCPSAVDPDNFSKFIDAGNPPVVGDNTATDFVLSGGRVCLDGNFVPVPCGGANVVYNNIDHNLGADTVAYAIIFPELNAALASLFANQALDLTQFTFHVDFRMGCNLPEVPDGSTQQPNDTMPDPICTGRSLNNGFEQLFLGTAVSVTNVPEPGTLALLGGMLAIIPLVRKTLRSSRKSA